MKPGLITEILRFLQSLGPGTLFFRVHNTQFDIHGLVDGMPVYIYVHEKYGKMSDRRIRFSAKVMHAGGKYYTVRSLDDICELAKVGGWHD